MSRLTRHKGRSHIIIPASLAFGTGEHATTAMSLRFLEQLTRFWNPGWSLADLGTGSGILALAAKCLGAARVIGIDNDPAAISVAKSNARLNKIRGASFQLGDVHTVEPGTEDRCDYGKFIQRFACRNLAKTTRRCVANSLGHFAQPTRRIGSWTAAESH